MPSLENKPRYWRSLEELDGQPEFEEFLQQEYPEQEHALKDPLSRRRFMQLMGASLSLSGVAGCRWDEDHIVPLSRRPDGYIPGEQKIFATSMDLGGVAFPLLARAVDGRPVKLEPNPEHPQGSFGTSTFAQASILGLYDPDRSQIMSRADLPSPTEIDLSSWLDRLRTREGGGRKLRVLSQASSSVTLAKLRDKFLKEFPGAKWHEYEALSRDNEREGTRAAFGAPQRVHYNFDNAGKQARARVVACFDSDILGNHPDSDRLSRELTRARDPETRKNGDRRARLYAVESMFGLVGAIADHRLPVPARLIPSLLTQLEKTLRTKSAPVGDDRYASFLRALHGDLLSAAGRSAVVVGPSQPPEAHATAARINSLLGSIGTTVVYTEDPAPTRPTHFEDIGLLAKDMQSGLVDTLLILGGNPVYDAPVDLDFKGGLAKVKNSFHLGLYEDETAAECSWHIPQKHYLESWSDGRSYDGTITIGQPLIDSLYPQAKSPVEFVAEFLGIQGTREQDLVRKSVTEASGRGLGEKAWQKVLHDGFVPATRFAPSAVTPRGQGRGSASVSEKDALQVSNGNLEVLFIAGTTYDGRFANNAWLQELPDFMSKLTWDNAALVSPHTASVLKIKVEDEVEVSVGGNTVTLPVYVLPGVAPGSVAVALGYGRTLAGQVGGDRRRKVDSIGADTFAVRQSAQPYIAQGATVTKTGRTYSLASTQTHWAIDDTGKNEREKRATHNLVYTATAKEYAENPDFVTKHAEIESVKKLIQTKTAFDVNRSLWEEHGYDKDKWGQPIYKWGMSVDLNKCTGCNACVIACQAENNIAVVGKEQVQKNREMHWLRIDRYFVGDPNQPSVAHQPVACMHCENAPCEQVCPVGATVHSTEGLNDMAYNRCVGTRYCANNCPYKVRRFNYHYLWKELDSPENASRKLAFNPEVTVRSRGVMEKCSFCTQRISKHRIKAKTERRRLTDGEFTTACAQACPSDAIVFGDLNDKKAVVVKNQKQPRSYALLAELNTKPRVSYLAKITNPHPDLVEASSDGHGGGAHKEGSHE